MTANEGQRRPTKCFFKLFLNVLNFYSIFVTQQPTTANEGQHRSTKANAGPRRPTVAIEWPMTANEGPRKDFLNCFLNVQHFYFIFVTQQPTKANAGQRRPTQVNEGQRRPMKAHSSQRRPTKANAGPRKPTVANDGQQRPTQAHEGPQ